MNISGDLLVCGNPQFRQEGRVEGKPFRQPVRRITIGVGGEDEIEAHRTGGHDLFPFRNLEMRLGGADDGDDDGSAREAGALRVLLLQVQFRFFSSAIRALLPERTRSSPR